MKIALQPGLPDVSALEQFLKVSGTQPQIAEKLSEMCRKPVPEARFITAYDRDRLIGFGCWAIPRTSDSAEIQMAVDPSYAEREIADPMLKLLVPAKSVVPAAAKFRSA